MAVNCSHCDQAIRCPWPHCSYRHKGTFVNLLGNVAAVEAGGEAGKVEALERGRGVEAGPERVVLADDGVAGLLPNRRLAVPEQVGAHRHHDRIMLAGKERALNENPAKERLATVCF